ncbi:MAG: undecaprenyl-phosphate glucose phosphotransferase [Halioglobus sp.]
MIPKVGVLRENSTVLSVIMHLIDWIAVLISAYLAQWFYLDDWSIDTRQTLPAFLGLALIAWLFSAYGLYRVWRGSSIAEELRLLFLAWSSVFLALTLFATLTKTGIEYSRGWGLTWYIIGFAGLSVFRLALRIILGTLRRSGYNLRQIVVAGLSGTIDSVLAELDKAPWIGLEVVGVFCEDENWQGKNSVKRLGGMKDLAAFTEGNTLDQVWIALPLKMEEEVHQLLHDLRHSTVNIRYVPDLFGMQLLNQSVSVLAGLSVINLSTSPMTEFNQHIKRLEDLIISVIILVLISPLLLLIAIAVKLSSSGPVFYRQERIGWSAKPFTMLKFRSMPVDVETGGVQWGGARSKNVTRVGAILRRTSMDELPQFINVLKGDMSIVGPRPERTRFVNQFKEEIPGYMKKHMVKAGITGWAQINGWRGDTNLETRIEYDLAYIGNWSLWLDLKIIFLTVFKGLVAKSAY